MMKKEQKRRIGKKIIAAKAQEFLIPFDSKAENELKTQAVVKLKSGHNLFSGVPQSVVERGKCIVDSISRDNRSITTKVCGRIFSVPFSQIEAVIPKPFRHFEQQFSAIGSMFGFYCYEGNEFYIRWFSRYELIANFIGTQPMTTLKTEVKHEKFYRDYFYGVVRGWSSALYKLGINLNDHSLDPVRTLDDKFKVMLNLLSDYIINNESCYCTVEEYLYPLLNKD